MKNEKVKNLFPKNQSNHGMKKRKGKLFKSNKTNTQRHKRSAIPYMQELLNKGNAEKNLILKGEM